MVFGAHSIIRVTRNEKNKLKKRKKYAKMADPSLRPRANTWKARDGPVCFPLSTLRDQLTPLESHDTSLIFPYCLGDSLLIIFTD